MRLTLASLPLVAACGAMEPGSVPPEDAPDPTTLERTGWPNDRLVCPAGACRAAADTTAPAYAIPPERLLEAWRTVLNDQPRARIIAVDEGRRLILAQDRTPVLRFVDTVAVRVLSAPNGGSTFAAYSRSEIGVADLGTNGRRLTDWTAALGRTVATRP